MGFMEAKTRRSISSIKLGLIKQMKIPGRDLFSLPKKSLYVGLRTTWRSWFSPSTIWILVTKLISLGLAASTFTVKLFHCSVNEFSLGCLLRMMF